MDIPEQTHTPPRRLALRLRRLPVFPGLVVGLVAATLLLPGGFDSHLYFFRDWWPGANAPAWIFLLTAPISRLPWPLPWTVLVVVTAFAARFAASCWGVSRWWVAMFSLSVLWNIWLGQNEVFGIMGAAIGWLVVQKRLHPAWLGIAWLGLLTKAQAGWGLAVLYAWWLWRDRGLKPLLWGGAVAGGVALLTLVLWPGWPVMWVTRLQQLAPQNSPVNAAIFPIGLAAWPVALMPLRMTRQRRTRMFAAASLLGSPYLNTYHCTTLMTMVDEPALLLISWVTVVPAIFSGSNLTVQPVQLGWLIPAAALALDAIQAYRARGTPGGVAAEGA